MPLFSPLPGTFYHETGFIQFIKCVIEKYLLAVFSTGPQLLSQAVVIVVDQLIGGR